MVALDCEMCETSEGLALTRITLVDRHGKVLCDYTSPETNLDTRPSPSILVAHLPTLQGCHMQHLRCL